MPGIDPAHDLTNKTSLRETCALLQRAAVLITGDSGPMHLAGGVGTPVIALFGPTTRAWGFFPAGSPGIGFWKRIFPAVPAPCTGKNIADMTMPAMKGITPDQVMQAVDELIQR